MYLLDVFRRKLEFPELKRALRELRPFISAKVVLIEDKASGSSLIQELRAEHLSLVQEAPKIDGDKVMRLHSQTAKIEGGFVLFPKEAHWLEAYLLELIGFPNSKSDDQVDSTVYALAWSTLNPPYLGWTEQSNNNFAKLVDKLGHGSLLRLDDGAPLVTISICSRSARSLLALRWWQPPGLLPAPDGFSNSRPRKSAQSGAPLRFGHNLGHGTASAYQMLTAARLPDFLSTGLSGSRKSS